MEFTKQPRVLLAQARIGFCTEVSGGNEVTQNISQGGEMSKKKIEVQIALKCVYQGAEKGVNVLSP